VRHVKNATGTMQRLSVAVLINERAPTTTKNEKGEVTDSKPNPYTEEEITRMQDLVRGVVGFDSARGDNVTVVPARFEAPAPLETIPWYLENTVQSALSSALIAISFIVFMMIVVRPIMRSITASKALAEEEKAQAAMGDGELSAEDMRMIQFGEGESLEEIKAKLKPKKSSISIDMLDTANTYDDKVALIRMLVAEDSGRVANVLKGMIKVS
jgi:flagellar M-ring protein FliF